MRSKTICIAAVAALAVTLWSSSAHANLENDTHNGVKGAVGLGLLGADLTLMIEGAARVRSPALLAILPIVVAGGGAAGGYFMGRASAAASVASLVFGLALIIPAAVLVAHGRSFRRERSSSDDEGFVDRTEEGSPYINEEDINTRGDETETEVLGPEGGSELEAPPQDSPDNEEFAPVEEEGVVGGGEASLRPLVASLHLGGGVLRIWAEESLSAEPGVTLSLQTF